MSYFGDPTIPTPVYPCGQGAYTGSVGSAANASTIVDASNTGTMYQFKVAYEAATQKPYKYKTQLERLQCMIESAKPANCPT